MTIIQATEASNFSDDVRNAWATVTRAIILDDALSVTFRYSAIDNGGWKGDEVNIRTEHASVKVQFVDEAEPEIPTGKVGLYLGCLEPSSDNNVWFLCGYI